MSHHFLAYLTDNFMLLAKLEVLVGITDRDKLQARKTMSEMVSKVVLYLIWDYFYL